MRVSPGARAALNVGAWVFIVLCWALLLMQMYCCMAVFWENNFLAVYALPFSRAKLTSGFGLYPPTLIDTFFVKQVLFTWPPILAIALLSIWMRHWPFRNSKESDEVEFDPSEAMRKDTNSSYRKYREQAKLFFLYQLPPRRFWGFLLEGGFSVADLIVFALWASLNALWLYLSYVLIYPRYYVVAYDASATDPADRVWELGSKKATVLDSLGYAGAWAAVYNLVFLFLPIPRNSFLQYLFNVDFSVLIKYHRWLGHGTLWITLFHGFMYYGEWFSISASNFGKECFDWQRYGAINNLAGSLTIFPFGLLLWITTIPWIRRRFFKWFLSTHIIGFLGFMFFLEIHYPSSIWYIPGLALYFMDVTFRLSQWNVISGVQCTFVSADKTFVTLRLKFNKAAKVRPTQFVFLNVPSVSRMTWHPLSIAGVAPGADGVSQDVTLHLKAYGSWTRGVIKQLALHGTIPVRADGPYGAAHVKPEWASYDTVVMVAGGIGVTPVLGMLRQMRARLDGRQAAASKGLDGTHDDANGNGQPHGAPSRVHLIWAVRNRDELQLLDPDLLETAGQSPSWLKLSLFNTKEADDYTSPPKAANGELNEVLDSARIGGQPRITRQLQPYGFGDFHWALAHLLAMAGAFFASLLVASYVAEGTATSLDGKPVWAAGMLFCLAFVVGSMGLPALIIYPLHFLRYRRHVRACEAAHRGNLEAPTSNGRLNGVHKAGGVNGLNGVNGAHGASSKAISEEQVERLMPQGRAKSGALDLETGKAATVSFGRPNFDKLIVEAVAEAPPGSRTVVIASGPSSLVVDARLATHKASKVARQLGLHGIPEIHFSNHSFTL